MGHHGGKASTPTLLDDNLKSKQFYRVLDLISEGPIYGPVDQTHISSFLLNKTPITDDAGNVNINGVTVAWREGSEHQDPIHGMSYIEATSIVNADVTKTTPLVRTITDPEVTRVRLNIGVSALVEQDDKGNQKNTTVTLAIETRIQGGNWISAKTVNITGKISGEYLEAHVITAPDTKPFDIRVSRVTDDSKTDLLNNGTVWNSYTEITDDNLNYPFSAICAAIVDRDQYNDTPNRNYHLRGLIVDVPANYNPTTRVYTGVWDGTFKQEWTDNPAWLFRELVKNTRFGLAKRAGYIDVDDGSLYVLSRYADELVNDGYGGKEPRLRLNAYITEHTTARELLDKIAGMFRGMALWDGMRLTVLLDNPADPIAAVTNANVVDGKFTYSSTKRSERFNAVVVSWTDPENGWKQSKEYVSDDAAIARYGYNETTMEAFGATSRGQAWRAGKWLLETAKLETRKVQFQMARDAIAFMPGDIIELMDNNYAAARMGGRIVSHKGATITVDAPVSNVVAQGDKMSIMDASGILKAYTVKSVAGDVVTLTTAPTFVKDGTVFVINSAKLATRLFRIMAITETANNSIYTINAAQHDPHKQAIVDDGAVFETPIDTLNGFRVPNIENLHIVVVNSETVQVSAQWETATTTRGLHFEITLYTEDGKRVVERHDTNKFEYPFYGLPAGKYQLGVRGINAEGMKGGESVVPMNIGAPAKPTSIAWNVGIFSATIVPFEGINATSDMTFEYWYSGETAVAASASITDSANYLGRGPQWTLHGLKADTIYYMYVRARNAFGVSDFVAVSGKASGDIPGMVDFVDQAVRASDEFHLLDQGIKDVQANIDTVNETITQTQTAINGVQADVIQAKADLAKDVTDMNTKITTMDGKVTAANTLIGNTKRDLEASIAAITGGGNTTITTMLNDIQHLKDENGDRLTSITGMTTRLDGMAGTIADQQKLWTAADKVVADRVTEVESKNDDQDAAITKNEQAITTLTTSVADRIDQMISATGTGKDHQALLTLIQHTESDKDRSLASSISSLRTDFDTNNTQITQEIQSLTDANSSTGERIDRMLSQTGNQADPDRSAFLVSVANTAASLDAAMGRRLDTFQAALNDNVSKIATETQVRTSAVSSLSQRITDTSSKVDGYDSRLTSVEYTLSDKSSGSIAGRINSLNTSVAGLRSDLTDEITSRTTDTATLNQRITRMVSANGSGSDRTALITTIEKTESDADKSLSQRVSSLDSALGANLARITSLEQAVATPDSSTAQRLTALETTTQGANGRIYTLENLNGASTGQTATWIKGIESTANNASSRISNIEKNGAAPNKAWADRIATLETKTPDLSAAIQQASSAAVNAVNNTVSAQWGVKVQATNRGEQFIAGMQLGLTGSGSKVQSNFIVSADRFSVYSPSSGAQDLVFGTQNGQLFIKSAFIQNGSIDMAKITGLIQSAGWNGGSGKGWALNQNGDFGIRTGAGNQRVEINGAGISVYDANGTLRVRVGSW